MNLLNQDAVDRFHRQGFLSGVRVTTDDEVRSFRHSYDAFESNEGRGTNRLADPHFNQRFVWDIATHPKILDGVEALIGPDFFLLSTCFFCKPGPDEKFVAWHQDLRYWGLEPPVAVSAWYAIDNSDRENGCMRVIPELHRDRLLEHGKAREQGNILSINQAVEVSEEEEGRAVDCVLKAGEISLHDGMLIHGSLPNRSTRRRCGLAIPFVPTHIRPVEAGPVGTDLKWRPVLVRGVDRGHHFETAQPPFPLDRRS